MSDNLGCLRLLFLAFMIAIGLATLEDCTSQGIVVQFTATGEEVLIDFETGLPVEESSDAIVSEPAQLPSAPTGGSNSSPGQPIIGEIINEEVDCTGLRPTSPTDGFAYAPTTFYWDAAPNLPAAEIVYTVLVYDSASGAPVTGASTSGDQTNLTIDMGAQLLAFSDQFIGALSWDIVASRNGETLCAASANGGAPIGVDIRNSPFEPGQGGGGSDETPPPDDEYEPPVDPPYEPPTGD